MHLIFCLSVRPSTDPQPTAPRAPACIRSMGSWDHNIIARPRRRSFVGRATMCDTFSVSIPKHCSVFSDGFTPYLVLLKEALQHGQHFRRGNVLQHIERLKGEPERKRSRPRPPKIGVLIVQCHLDRLVWNAFLPLVLSASAGDDCPLLEACIVLRRHYKRSVHFYAQQTASAGETKEASIPVDGTFYEQCVSVGQKRKRRRSRNTLIIILPPYPHANCTSPPTLEPERLFTSRLVRLENIMVRLQSCNAFVATLGGGYFLCRYLTMAVQLARWQRAIALSLGDRNLAGRCTVNEAYNYMHAGKLAHALQLIKKVKADAIERGDKLTVSMCKSARYFAKRVQKMQAFEGSKQDVDDDVQRIRIVADDAKINRTFRPLHEL